MRLNDLLAQHGFEKDTKRSILCVPVNVSIVFSPQIDPIYYQSVHYFQTVKDLVDISPEATPPPRSSQASKH